MLIKVNNIPGKSALRKKAGRALLIEEFLSSGFRYAEVTLEGTDTPRRAYNGLMMAIRRQFEDKCAVLWRHGRIFLMRLEEEKNADETVS